MGRLTLNVLLSFAQFEREVTGEQIRDKVAASKKKGMWMGGFIPLGYNLKDRQLTINLEEAEIVQEIFRQYLRLGRVSALKRYLEEKNVRSKLRHGVSGIMSGGKSFSRGALYHILNRRLYIGEIAHRGNVYPVSTKPSSIAKLGRKSLPYWRRITREIVVGAILKIRAC
jgi:site-specific DNA recombinase